MIPILAAADHPACFFTVAPASSGIFSVLRALFLRTVDD